MYSLMLAFSCQNMLEWIDYNVIYIVSAFIWYTKQKILLADFVHCLLLIININKYISFQWNTTILYYLTFWQSDTNCFTRCTHTKPSHHNTMEKFVAANLLQKLQFILKIQYISVIIRRHGIVKIWSTSTTQYSAHTKEKFK